MPSNDTVQSLKEIMIDVFDNDDLDIDQNTTADDVEEWDSLSHIRLIVRVERKFGVKFTNSEIESLKNVGDLAKLIDAKVG